MKDSHCDGGNLVLVVLLVHEIGILSRSLGLVLLLSVFSHVGLDTGSNGKFGGPLTDFGQIRTRETGSVFGEEVEVDTWCKGRLSQSGSENRQSRGLVRKGNVDELQVSIIKGEAQERT
jgi:hypothetical protein